MTINSGQTLEGLRDVIAQELPMAYDIYVKAVSEDDERETHWARGRVDGLLQTLKRIDKDKYAELDSIWQKTWMTATGVSDDWPKA
ncbi:hypothetical protein A0W34_09405 [Rhodococcus sp. BH4]|uniref:hypothetical protein n=1 Tax=Rhodococcus sp. BH4 TaxID=1807790 RepID=UPI0009C2E7E0|nr:hypothetical protein [Rhodococcus sp. BH4]ARE33530.1 hypothetical protein A0W34_09405 [Rhodococcus sp. BH4]